jgi:hypothetical protein
MPVTHAHFEKSVSVFRNRKHVTEVLKARPKALMTTFRKLIEARVTGEETIEKKFIAALTDVTAISMKAAGKPQYLAFSAPVALVTARDDDRHYQANGVGISRKRLYIRIYEPETGLVWDMPAGNFADAVLLKLMVAIGTSLSDRRNRR